MPNIICTKCGQTIYVDPYATPYEGELACPHCKNVMKVSIASSLPGGATIETKYPNPRDEVGEEIWPLLNKVERNSLIEAAIAEEREFKPYSQAIEYFRGVRNKLGHPEKVSSKLDAESSYKMALRLIKELITEFLKPVSIETTKSRGTFEKDR